MSLSAREQQALESIERRLACSDPELAARLATFTRLASGEGMPVREKIHMGWRRAARILRSHQSRSWARQHAYRTVRRQGWQPIMILVVLLITLAVALTVLALDHGGTATCRTSWTVSCTAHASGQGPPAAAPLRW